MTELTSNRGFQIIYHDCYPPTLGDGRLVGESSAIGLYDDSFDRPGSSFLWVGHDHHLNREEVAQLRDYLTHWLDGNRLYDKPITPTET